MNSPRLRLLLARHGEAESNRQGRFLGRSDSPLTFRGKVQAQSTAEALFDEPLAAIYTSPLRRASETAKTIALHHHCPLHVENRLIEQNFGQWEGLTFEEAAQRFPHGFIAWQTNANLAGPTGGEILPQVVNRVVDLYNEISGQYESETVLLVTHGGVINALLCALLQTPLRWLWAYRTQPGSLGEVLIYEGGAVLSQLNRI